MYIRNIKIDIKETLALSLSILLIYILAASASFKNILLGILFSVLTFLTYAILKNGFFYTLKRINKDGQIYELRDYINLLKPDKNHRDLVTPSGALDSTIYTKNIFQKWGYFDEIRLILEKYIENTKMKDLNILVLGGGLGSIAGSLSLNPHVKQIKVVEISKEVIQLAKSFSLNKLSPTNRNKIMLINDDAIKYVFKEKLKHDFIFVDIFDNIQVVKEIYSLSFLKQAKNTLKASGVIIINIGINPDFEYIKNNINVQSVFKNFKVYYTPRHSFLGFATNNKENQLLMENSYRIL